MHTKAVYSYRNTRTKYRLRARCLRERVGQREASEVFDREPIELVAPDTCIYGKRVACGRCTTCWSLHLQLLLRPSECNVYVHART